MYIAWAYFRNGKTRIPDCLLIILFVSTTEIEQINFLSDIDNP